MKKLLLFFALSLFSAGLFAQAMTEDGRCAVQHFLNSNFIKGTTEMGDFTITDSDGVTHNLYASLDQGMTIMLDLFFTT
jgi:cytochrome oxidase Cu insertion factor (SCO1/SenC/PrrC family)